VAQVEQERLRREMDRNPLVWFPDLPGRVAAARAEIAAFLHVAVEDLALVPNASAGASVVFASLPHRRGGEILVTDHGYGAVTMGAERLARRWGGTVRTARVPLAAGAEQAYEAVVAELSDATGLIVLDHITSATARRMPVARIGAEARRRGIPLLVDAAHVPGLIEAPADRPRLRLLGRQPAQVRLRAAGHVGADRARTAARRAVPADRLVGC
jgi:isopenicillin-N epimerase